MRIHELIEDAKITKEGLEYLSELDERIKEENKELLLMIERLQEENKEIKQAFSFKEEHYVGGWMVYETKSRGEVVDELRSKIDSYLA